MSSLAPTTALRLQGSVSAESAADLVHGVPGHGVPAHGSSGQGSSARVLAAFPDAAYLLFDHSHDAVVALLRRQALQLPNGVRLMGADTPDLRTVLDVGDQVRVAADELGVRLLRVGALRISLIGSHQPTRVRVQPDHHLDADDLDALGAAPSLRSRAARLAAGLEADDPAQLADLIGWGRGLTPTGDDLTCGVLLALVATEHLEPAHALDLLGGHGLRTTSLSARLLGCAARGLAVPQVVDLVDTLLAPGRRVTTAQVRAVHAIGHSSGRDLCAGLAGALDHVLGADPAPPTNPHVTPHFTEGKTA
ncbi:DUF2877 domain-containing protein [Propionibacteriaceae bacterium Y1923]|uniref:oxamate carbamoyltransferase subunit AllH family protein n=1 Tax=Aestuariimicrobium sp. Y1814 TaxID=3418742 RepID=UPI003C2770BD